MPEMTANDHARAAKTAKEKSYNSRGLESANHAKDAADHAQKAADLGHASFDHDLAKEWKQQAAEQMSRTTGKELPISPDEHAYKQAANKAHAASDTAFADKTESNHRAAIAAHTAAIAAVPESMSKYRKDDVVDHHQLAIQAHTGMIDRASSSTTSAATSPSSPARASKPSSAGTSDRSAAALKAWATRRANK